MKKSFEFKVFSKIDGSDYANVTMSTTSVNESLSKDVSKYFPQLMKMSKGVGFNNEFVCGLFAYDICRKYNISVNDYFNNYLTYCSINFDYEFNIIRVYLRTGKIA